MTSPSTAGAPPATAPFATGSLVRARGREWTVLPDSTPDMLQLRPLGGTEDEVTGIFLPLETVVPASFPLPDAAQVGDYRSARLLRDAVRLGFRSSAGPFRSFAKIAVEPRPYQLVPLLMGLKQDTVRLLIADDVGIGKTVEASLVARELLDRGEARRLAVLCPPHLAEQWQTELATKFHIEAELVLASTARRLERVCRVGESLFEHYPHVIVSMDFIKSEKRQLEFLRTCPELVIVDEAHTCAFGDVRGGGRHQRYELVKGLAADPDRHMILVTATPHSGKEEAFRSLLTILDPAFAHLPDDLTGARNEMHRRRLAQHLVQRRRADIRHYLQEDTPFPERREREATYTLSPEYKQLFERALDYAREAVQEPGEAQHRQRVRWWSALALLRALASSPAAAAETLRMRAANVGAATSEEADEIGRRSVLDMDGDDAVAGIDVVPGSDVELDGELADGSPAGDAAGAAKHRRRLREMAKAAEALCGDKDQKLVTAAGHVKALVAEGYSPIVFCRFIHTADYVAAELRKRLPKDVEVVAVTGTLPPAEREQRVMDLATAPKRVLVATDCLSEGINLQHGYDAVFHYDLAWNPTRHEQREGRVDRYGQPSPEVRVLTYYGKDNQIDGIVLEVLLRKHKTIRNSLGVSVPVPGNTNDVIEAVFDGLLLRERSGNAEAQQLALFNELVGEAKKHEVLAAWEAASEREKRSRTMFAQEGIKPEEVAQELDAMRASVGSGVDVAAFVRQAVVAHKGHVTDRAGAVELDLREVPRALRDAMGGAETIAARFALPVQGDEAYLSRTHPAVEGLASYVMEAALDADGQGVARRSGAVRTDRVQTRTTLLLVRYRFHILTKATASKTTAGKASRAGVASGGAMDDPEQEILAEDLQLLAFEGSPANARWLDAAAAQALLDAVPTANITPEQATDFVERVVTGYDALRPHLEQSARERADALLEAHKRVRTAAKLTGVSTRVEPTLPVDVLGVYVYLPA